MTEAGLGSDAFTRVTIDANKRITDTLAIRVDGLYHDGDTPGRRQVWQKRFGSAAALHWEATPKATLDADYYYLDLSGMADYDIPFDTRVQRPFAVDPNNFYGAVGRDFLSGSADIATGTLRHNPSEAFALRSMTRLGAVANRYVVSVPGRPTITAANPAQWTVSVGTTQRNAISRSVDTINDATLHFDISGISHTIVTGMEYPRERVRNLLNPNPFLVAAVPALPDLTAPDSINTVETVSDYFIDTLKFGERVQLDGRGALRRLRNPRDRRRGCGGLRPQTALRAAQLAGQPDLQAGHGGHALRLRQHVIEPLGRTARCNERRLRRASGPILTFASLCGRSRSKCQNLKDH